MADLRDFISFEGILKSNGHQWEMPFRARIGDDGEIEFEIPPIPLTRETLEIERLWFAARGRFHLFQVTGDAPDGTRFESATLFFKALTSHIGGAESRLEVKARCQVGKFVQPIEKPNEKLSVRQALRGFECFGRLYALCPLGEVFMAGATPLPEGDRLSGWLHIICDKAVPRHDDWQKEVLKLFEHIRNVMSFAQSRYIRAPVLQTWTDQKFEVEVRSQTSSQASGIPVFSPTILQPIFEAAVASFFNTPIAVKKLYFAIEWFAMQTVYSETRLLNAMTALENLTNANLDAHDLYLLPDAAFDKLCRTMRKALPAPSNLLEKEFRADLPGKLQELNRRALRKKIQILADRWGVYLGDLPADGLKLAIRARNNIVHRGHYYDDETERAKKESLWPHIFLVREIVVRMILATIGFKGNYVSFLSGADRIVQYPPVTDETQSATAKS